MTVTCCYAMFLFMKFIDNIDFKTTKASTFFVYSGLALIFSGVADVANLYLHIQDVRSIFDPKPSALMQVLTSDTFTSGIEILSSLNATSALGFAVLGISKLAIHPPSQKRNKQPINPWRPSV